MTAGTGWLCALGGFGLLLLAAVVTAHFTQRTAQELRKLREQLRNLVTEWRSYR